MRRLAGLSLALTWFAAAAAADDADELAKKLSNPVASLISVPFQYNFDEGAGPAKDGHAHTLNIQPVIPISLGEGWTVISRTILPIASRDYLPGEPFGLGDITQSLFFSPKAPDPGGLIWGVGPAALIPTATDEFLGSHQWGVGPTGVALVQKGPWTFGGLANHIWSVSDAHDRPEVDATFLQPFVAYSLGKGVTLSANLEASYDWTGREWTVPLNLGVAKVTKIGHQPVSFQVGGRVYLDRPKGGPDWGVRSTVTFLFPEK